MADYTFNCSKCGAPIQYDGSDVPAVRCSFCNSLVLVPPQLRPPKKPQVHIFTSSDQELEDSTPSPRSRFFVFVVSIAIGIFILSILSVFFIPYIVTKTTSQTLINAPISMSTATPVPTVTATPVPTSTPAYAMPQISFGKKGMNPGQFDNARDIACDGQETIYVADYDDGRIQAFDSNGKFLHQWRTGDDVSKIHGLAADRGGFVYVSQGGYIYKFNGESGETLARFSHPAGGDFGDMAIDAQGALSAMWYEGRWGIITSLEGHSEAVVFFDAAGNIVQTIAAPISGLSNSVVLDASIAIDGKDNIYLLENLSLYIYSPDGKYQNKVSLYTPRSESGFLLSNLCIDGQGQLYVSVYSQVYLYNSDGRYITDFPAHESINSMAIDLNDDLWLLERDQVTRYVKYAE